MLSIRVTIYGADVEEVRDRLRCVSNNLTPDSASYADLGSCHTHGSTVVEIDEPCQLPFGELVEG